MPKIIFIDADEQRTEVELEPGETVMSLAVNHLVEGILGECGGAMACATCHCYLDKKYAGVFAPINPVENSMLDLAVDRHPDSRLACQLDLTDEIEEDIEIRLPAVQA